MICGFWTQYVLFITTHKNNCYKQDLSQTTFWINFWSHNILWQRIFVVVGLNLVSHCEFIQSFFMNFNKEFCECCRSVLHSAALPYEINYQKMGEKCHINKKVDFHQIYKESSLNILSLLNGIWTNNKTVLRMWKTHKSNIITSLIVTIVYSCTASVIVRKWHEQYFTDSH